MSKYCNVRNVGVKFKVGDKVLKMNIKDATRLEKLRKKYVGPYMIRDNAPSGNYYLTDRFSHDLKKPVPPNHLIHFNRKGNFRNSHKNLSSGVLEENTTVDMESDSDRRENEGSASGGKNSESLSEDCTGDEIIGSAKLVDRKEVRCDSSFLSSQDSHGIDRIDVYSGDDNKSASSKDKDINSSESEETEGFNENDPCDSDSIMSHACQRIVEYNHVTKKRKMQ